MDSLVGTNFFDATVGTWIGVFVGLVGLIVAYVFYRRSLIKSKIVFIKRTFHITGRYAMFPPELKIFYGDKEIENITQTKIIIWNAGTSTIGREQLVHADPLRIVLAEGSEILAGAIATTTRKVNALVGVRYPERANEWLIGFDFLDPRDGGVIQLTHTGPSSGARVSGTIRGIPEGVIDLGEESSPPGFQEITQAIGVIIFGLLILSLGLATILSPATDKVIGITALVVAAIFGAPMIFAGVWLGLHEWKKVGKRPPKELLKDGN